MTNELAKQLKDAGFPQGYPPDYFLIPSGIGDTGEVAYYPPLHELIDACGENFWTLERVAKPLGEYVKWCAYDMEFYRNTGYFGATPEEAVANLWLALMESPRS